MILSHLLFFCFGLSPGWLGLRPIWMTQRGGTNEQTYINLPILQDFVPYSGCCPKTKVEQGNGTAAHLIFFDNLFPSTTHLIPHSSHTYICVQIFEGLYDTFMIHLWYIYFIQFSWHLSCLRISFDFYLLFVLKPNFISFPTFHISLFTFFLLPMFFCFFFLNRCSAE